MVLADIYITVHPKAIHIAFGLCVLDTQLCVLDGLLCIYAIHTPQMHMENSLGQISC